MDFGRTVRRRRQEQKLTLEELADRAGLTPNYLGSVELGRRDPSLSTILALAKALGTTAGELLGVKDIGPIGLEAGRLVEQIGTEAQDAVITLLRTMVRKRR